MKTFLFTGLFYGIGMGIYFSFENGFLAGSVAGLLGGVLFGFVMASSLSFFHWLNTKHMKGVSDTGPRQDSTVVIHKGMDEAFSGCLSALDELGAKINIKDKKTGTIKATTGISWKSFGEVISIEVTEQKKKQSNVVIRSMPKLKTTIIDYGKAIDNIKKLENLLRSG